jgi:hypothetical protein
VGKFGGRNLRKIIGGLRPVPAIGACRRVRAGEFVRATKACPLRDIAQRSLYAQSLQPLRECVITGWQLENCCRQLQFNAAKQVRHHCCKSEKIRCKIMCPGHPTVVVPKGAQQSIKRTCNMLAAPVIGQCVAQQLQRERIFAEQLNPGRKAPGHRPPIRTHRAKSRKQGMIACRGIVSIPEERAQFFECFGRTCGACLSALRRLILGRQRR